MAFGFVDVGVVLLVLISLLDGIRVGALRVTFGALTLAASVVLAVLLQEEMTSSALEITTLPLPVSRAVALAEVMLLGDAVLTFLGHFVFGRVPTPHGGWAGTLSVAAGALVGAGRGVLAATAGLAILILVPLGGPTHDDVDRSLLGSELVVVAVRSERALPLGDRRLFDVRLDGTTEVPFDAPIGLVAARDEATEKLLASLANRERSRRNVRELIVDPRLTEVARRHSEEMIRLRSFGHRSPITGLAEDRLTDAGIRFGRVHEVLVLGSSALVINARVVESTLQGARMLDPDARRMGIGVLDAGAHGLVVTELFVTDP